MASTSASGLFGRVGEFNVARETFSAYVERMEMFFTANNIVTTREREALPPTLW